MLIDIRQISGTHAELRKILEWLEESTGLSFTITSQHRKSDTGVHGTIPTRAHDLRMRHRGIGEEIEKYINDNWVYDPSRPQFKCALLHGDGLNLHLHIQIHPTNTRRK